MSAWPLFTADSDPHERIDELPAPPPWRCFDGAVARERRLPDGTDDDPFAESSERARTFRATSAMVETVNASLFLRRPLLVTGRPGSGKSSLIYAVARQLKLGRVLRWPITSRSTLQHGLYQYDAIGRLQDAQRKKQETEIGRYLELGPLGTALLPTSRPRALLIDEIDKSDIDLPNDLLNVFEEGEYSIPELARLDLETVDVRTFGSAESFPITRGLVRCREFPFVVLTSNGEREFSPAFLRRCIRMEMPQPDDKELAAIVESHLGPELAREAGALISEFWRLRGTRALATDQLLNAAFLVIGANGPSSATERDYIKEALLHELSEGSLR